MPRSLAMIGWYSCLVLLVACNSGTPSSPAGGSGGASGTVAASKPIPVELLLNWVPEAEHGGYYAALVHGYFKDEGLDVTIQPGGPGAPVLATVATRTGVFGVDNADKLLLARKQEAEVVSLFAPLQDSPRCVMVHRSSGIRQLADLAKHGDITLAMNPEQPSCMYLQKKVGLGQTRIVPYAGNVAPFLLDPKYAQQAYSFSEPFLAEKQGSDPECLMLSSIGFNTYTSILVASQATIERSPEVAEKLTRASQRGWERYLTDPAETHIHISKINPEMSREALEFGWRAIAPLCTSVATKDHGIGWQAPERWETLAQQFEEIDVAPRSRTRPDAAFTNKFLPPVKATTP